MKQTLLTRLVLGAFAGIAVSSAAQAGQITASSTNIAREVIVANDQQIVSPTVSYRFAGDIDATVQTQEFQVQFTLEGGAKWDPTAVAAMVQANFAITPTTGAGPAPAPVAGTPLTAGQYQLVAKGVNDVANPTTLWVTLRVPAAAGMLVGQPVVTLNTGAVATKATVTNLKTIVGDLATDFAAGKCADSKSLFVNVKHFKLLSNPNAIADGTTNGVEDESIRAGFNNRAGIINFPTNIQVSLSPSQGSVTLDATSGNMKFTKVSLPVAPAVDVDATGAVAGTTALKLLNLGSVNFTNVGVGYDTNLANVYALSALNTVGATATSVAGLVDLLKAQVVVKATAGFAPGATLRLNSAANCAVGTAMGAVYTITPANASADATLELTAAADIAKLTGAAPVYVCYDVTGATTQIPTSAFTGVGTLIKSANGLAAPAYNNEQNNACSGSLYTLGGGIKIDVRNYANSKDPSGWYSVIRLINNSEVTNADIWGQLIHPDGTYGPWGKLTDLAPRGVLNMTSAQIDAKLVNAPGAGAANGAGTPQTYTATGAPRLRITSTKGTTLRVQNYMVNPATGAIAEFSGSQGVDYDGALLRAPAADGQYISQDAQAGLNGK